MRVYTLGEAAVRCGVSPRDIRLMIEEGRLRARRRGGARVVDERELELAGLLGAEGSEGDAGVPPPLAVVLQRLEEKAAELAAVRSQLADAESRHADEVKALRREVHELRERARRVSDDRDPKDGIRPSLRALFGEGAGEEEPPAPAPGR